MSSVPTLQPHWPVPARVRVHSTTRIGGVSQSPYNAMNVGLHVGDNERHVQENRERLKLALDLPTEPLWLNQVHGTHVPVVSGRDDSAAIESADGAFTQEPHYVLAAMTADCLPVVLSNRQGTAIAAVHAGWRGLAAGVLQSALEHFAASDEVCAWLAPAIGPAAFEVGADVHDAFVQTDERHAKAFKTHTEGKYLADLYALARTELNRSRRVETYGGEYCTVEDSERFHSHRRDGRASGRMVTLAWIDPSETAGGA